MNPSGKTAPSFIAAIALVVLVIGGYIAWGILRPNPIARSEMVVRDFSAAAAGELGSLRRALREELARYTADPSKLDSVRATIDEHADEVREELEMLANDAIDQLTMIEGIGLQTQDNRLQRIKKRRAEAEARLDDLVAEAREKLPEKGP
jgi:hypothetical protein